MIAYLGIEAGMSVIDVYYEQVYHSRWNLILFCHQTEIFIFWYFNFTKCALKLEISIKLILQMVEFDGLYFLHVFAFFSPFFFLLLFPYTFLTKGFTTGSNVMAPCFPCKSVLTAPCKEHSMTGRKRRIPRKQNLEVGSTILAICCWGPHPPGQCWLSLRVLCPSWG